MGQKYIMEKIPIVLMRNLKLYNILASTVLLVEFRSFDKETPVKKTLGF